MARILSLAAVVLFALIAASEAQKITNLPGWNPQVPYNMYSGYIDLSEGKRYFYWYVIYPIAIKIFFTT